MSKVKKIIIILTVIAVSLLLFIILLAKDNQTENISTNQIDKTIEYAFSQIKDYETYYKIKAILNNYVVYIRQINGEEKIEVGKLGMTEEEAQKALQDQGLSAVKKILDEQYLEEMSLSDEEIKNQQTKYKNNSETYNLNVEDAFEIDIDKNIKLILTESKLNNVNFPTLIKLDKQNNTYSIFLEDYINKYSYDKNMDRKSINISSKLIEENSFNSKIEVNITEPFIVSQYFVEYKGKMINDTETAYELLNEEYKQKKYGSYENFKKYVDTNKQRIMSASIDKYQIIEKNDIKKYICVDKDGRYYIFSAKDVIHYEVMLDTYTIDLPEFLEEYNNSNEEIRCGMNIQKLMDAINNDDYLYVYNKLDETFRKNNFSNQDVFKEYIEAHFKNRQIEYEDYEKNGEIYIYNIKLIDNNQQEEQETIIMKLLEDTDFKFSFNVK